MNWLNESDYETISIIEKCKEKIKEKEKEIDSIKFDIDTYNMRLILNIHNIVPIVSEKLLHNVWSNFKKEEKEENYKSNYDYISHIIKQYVIGDTDCNYKKKNLIDNIICCGYESYAYSVYFTVNKIEFFLEIPNIKSINIENMVYAHEGKYALFYKSSNSCSTCISQSYDLNDLQKAFKEFIERSDI